MQTQPTPPSGSVVESNRRPATSFIPPAPGATPAAPTAAPLTSTPDPLPEKKSPRVDLIKTIAIIVLSVLLVVFIGLFIWKMVDYSNLSTDIEGQIDAANARVKEETVTKMEEEFLEREKYPYKTFTGPADYGSLSFEYPKTWSVYIDKDASNGGNFEAYLNPSEIEPVSPSTVNALRVSIRDNAFDSEVRTYESYIKNGKLTLSTRTIGGALANVYTGDLPNGGLRGIVAIFKLRDKTVFIQTDAEIFAQEYYKLLDTVTFVE